MSKKLCPECGGEGSWYGMAPHYHNISKTGTYIGSTVLTEEFSDNFTPDAESGGTQGIWTCKTCGGTGEIE